MRVSDDLLMGKDFRMRIVSFISKIKKHRLRGKKMIGLVLFLVGFSLPGCAGISLGTISQEVISSTISASFSRLLISALISRSG